MVTSPEASTRSRSALANPQFRLLYFSSIATMLGFGMNQVAQGVLSFNLTGRNTSVGFVAMAMGLPMLLLGPVGGALSDRMSKRFLLLLGQSAVGTVFFAVGLLTAFDVINIWMLAGLALLLGCTFATLMPAGQAWVGELLKGPALANGVALQQLAMNGTRIAGPLGAGLLISLPVTGIGGTYMAMAGFFLLSLGFLFLMNPTTRRIDAGRTSVGGDLVNGLSYTWHQPEVRLLMLTFMGVVLTAFTYMQLLPGLLEHELGQPASRVGLMFGAAAVGGITLTLILSSYGQRRHPMTVMFSCGAALAASVALLAACPTFLLALLASVLVGAAGSGFQMSNQLSLMQKTDPAFLGRVMALTMTAFGMQMAVGFPVGILADYAGERLALVVLACCCLAVVSAGFVSSQRSRRRSATEANVTEAPAGVRETSEIS